MMTRSRLLGWQVVLLACCIPVLLGAQRVDALSPLQALVGEDYHYAIDFLFFTKLGAGQLRLAPTAQPNVFQAELVGHTLGVASWLAGERTQTYTSLMELSADGFLRSIEHTSRIVKRRWGKLRHRERHYRYDYAQGKVYDQKTKDGRPAPQKEHAIPPGQQPVDMLTAFYNLRTGAYGPLVRGASFAIPTCSGKGFSAIEVEVLSHAQQAEHGYFPTHGLLVQVKLDPELFATGSGKMYIWFDAGGVPGRGIVEDLVGMGDVRGYLDLEGL